MYPGVEDIVRIDVGGGYFTVAQNGGSVGTYSALLVNSPGPRDAATQMTPLSRAMGPHFLLTPNGYDQDDPARLTAVASQIIIPIGPGVVTVCTQARSS